MARPQGTALVAIVVGLAIAQIFVEDVIVFLGATGAVAPGVTDSPAVMIAVPFVLFLALVAVLWAWALGGDDPRYE